MQSINLPDRIPYRKGRFWGYCNEKKESVIACKYEVVCFFSEGLARVRSNFLKWSMIDKNGSTITKYDYTDLQDYQEGLAAVRRNDKWGYINRLGKEIILCTYSKAFSFNQGLARVKNSENQKWGFIDSHQNIIVDFNYDEATDFQKGIAKVRLKDRWGIVNKFGILICPCIYLEIGNFKDNLSIVKKQIEDESYYGVIDINGLEVVPSQMDYIAINSFISCNHDNKIYRHYDSFSCHKLFDSENQISCYSGSFNILETSDHFYYLIAENDLNQTPISNYYNGIRPVFENLAISIRDGKYGLLDKTGKEIVPPIYLKFEKFSDEYFIAMNDEGLFGLLDKNGKTSMPHKFTYISQFSKNLFIVSNTKGEVWTGDYYIKKTPCWLVHKNGKQLNNIKYDFIGNLSEEFSQLATVRQNEMFGLINHNGDEIVECIYSIFERLSDDLILAKKEEGYGIINVNGEEIVKCIYTNLRKKREYSLCYVSRIVEANDNNWLIADGYVDFEGNEYWEGTKSDWIYKHS